MSYQWRSGFHAPSGVSVEKFGATVEGMDNPCPEQLLEDSKKKTHVIHSHLWTEGDQVWANRARLSECRQMLSSIKKVELIGGEDVSYRVVEFLSASKTWVKMEVILADNALLEQHFLEIEKLQQQAVSKMANLRMLLMRKFRE
jgi:hypothetical protein